MAVQARVPAAQIRRRRHGRPISLDGYVAGPDQSLEQPLGRDGMKLHRWHLDEPLNDADQRACDLLLRPRGAYIMGRNMFGPVRGAWHGDWRG
jgi:hypothetical protein